MSILVLTALAATLTAAPMSRVSDACAPDAAASCTDWCVADAASCDPESCPLPCAEACPLPCEAGDTGDLAAATSDAD